MKSQALSLKLLVTSLSVIVLMASILVWRSYSGISDLSQALNETTEHNLSTAVIDRLGAESLAYSERISGFINSAFRISFMLQGIIQNSISAPEKSLSRNQVNDIVGSALANSPDVSAAYAYFEPNGFDGLDAENSNSYSLHSRNYRGNFDSYWRRLSKDEIVQEAVDPDEKYHSTPNEFGIRESEWYLCPKETHKPCVMEPFSYEVSGETIVLSTLSVPIIVDGQFHGMAGVDIELHIFQNLAEQLSQSLYNGQAKVTFLSQQGLIISSSHFLEKQLRPLKEAMPKLGEQLSKLHLASGMLDDGESIFLARPIVISAANTQWSLLIELPKAIAMAELYAQQKMASEQQASTTQSQVLIGIILTVIAMVIIAIMLRSITQPLNVLNQQISQLASADGDLSQRLHLDTHAELIQIGNNFNLFMEKLRDMVISLQQIGETTRQEAQTNLSLSRETNDATASQQSEIDNVVTATQEMSATALEVANIAADVSTRTTDMHSQILGTQETLSATANSALELTNNMHTASHSIHQVSDRSNEINRILEVIGAIAEQTNLLALNAAIEAARAGEHGRGFAVVADEVRTLASRTQTSTEEINTMIQDLQQEVAQAVQIVDRGSKQANDTMESTQTANQALNDVVEAISVIADNIRQVATAAEEQSAVSEEITRNLTVIGDAAETINSLGQQASQSSHNVTNQVDALEQQLSSLRT